MAATSARSNGTRQRIVEAANDLFYAHGIAVTSVDDVVARAGVSKPTLYRYFPSKGHLIAAYLVLRDQINRDALEAAVSRHHPGTRDRLLAVFDWLDEWHQSPTYRGCAFARAAAEFDRDGHPADEIIRERKLWLRERLRDLAAEAGVSDVAATAGAFMLLVEGANTTAFVEGDLQAAGKARGAARALLAADAP